MKLVKVRTEETEKFIRLIGVVDINTPEKSETIELFFEYPIEFKSFVNVKADPFFPVLLLPAMQNNEELIIEPELSALLLENQEKIQDIFTNWYPETFHKIDIIANRLHSNQMNSAHSAQFFSLGVDSFHSLIKNQSEDHKYLIYMQGLELPLSVYREGQGEMVVQEMKNLEPIYNVKLIYGRTNFRNYFSLDWASYYFGAGLSATAHSLNNGFGKVFIPSGHSYSSIMPSGSSFVTDNFWSTENLEVIHDGCETSRSGKILDFIANDPYAFHNIRVCTENKGGNYNCCKCRKCQATMLVLHIAGKLEQCDAFPIKKVGKATQTLGIVNQSNLDFAEDLHQLALKHRKYKLAKKLEIEIMVGKHDVFGRHNVEKSLLEYTKEMIQYLYVKAVKKMN